VNVPFGNKPVFYRLPTCVVLFISLLAGSSSAQQRDPSTDLAAQAPREGLNVLGPPPGPVRQPAEFEPMKGVMIRYPFGIPHALIKEMAEDTKVVTIVRDKAEQLIVDERYRKDGIKLNNCSFILTPSDTHWTRDYGPWSVIDGNGNQGFVDNRYPFPGPNDDIVPLVHGRGEGIAVYQTGIHDSTGCFHAAIGLKQSHQAVGGA